MRLISTYSNRAALNLCLSLSVVSALAALLAVGALPGQTAGPQGGGGSDVTGPRVIITSPTESSTFSTGIETVTLRGIATDNVGVTQVTCATDRGGNCTSGGTTNWTAQVTGLPNGTSVVTVSARDAAGNVGTQSLAVTSTPSAACGDGTSEAYRVNGGPPLHPNGTLIKTRNNPAIYLLQNGQRRLIASPSLLNSLYSNGGFDLKDVITVAADELNLYPVGPVVDSTLPSNGQSQPDGRLIRRLGGSEISIVTDGGRRRPFTSEGAFTGLGYRYCNVVDVLDYDAYPADLPADAQTVLVITSLEPSSVQTRDWGESVTFTFTVRDALGNPVSGAAVGGQDNLIMGAFTAASVTDSNGQGTYTTTVPNGTANGLYDIVFFASKAGFTTSAAVTRQIQVSHTSTSPTLTIASVEPSALQVKDWGESVTYTITVTDGNGAPVSGATVVGEDDLRGTTFTTSPNTTGGDGRVTYVTTVPDGKANGVFDIRFRAQKSGFDDSAAVTRQVEVRHFVGTVITVTNANDSGVGSLRQAILDSNATAGPQTIAFDIPGAGVRTIALTSPLPRITDPVVIDGYTQPGARRNTAPAGDNAILLIELNGADATGFDTNGLYITAGGSVVRGLIISRFSGPFFGAAIVLAENGGNLIEGNRIGANSSGNAASANLRGVMVFSPNNTVGGTTPGARNLISGNEIGVMIRGAGATGNRVQGNFIGTNAAGTAALGNSSVGVFIIEGASDNTVGGTEATARNVISGNDAAGVYLSPNAKRNLIQGNFIGTNAAGAAAVGNGDGLVIDGGSDNTVGGTAPGARNLISGNFGQGVRVAGNTLAGVNATGNVIQGNYIGTNAEGTGALGNGAAGVNLDLSASDNSIGGAADGAGNLVAFNATGVDVNSGTGNAILSNSIFSNQGQGISLAPGANNDQPAPTMSGVFSFAGGTIIQGALDAAAAATFNVQFFSSPVCDASGRGEGKSLIGATAVTTDGDGQASFTVTVPGVTSAGQVVTATATDAEGNTSEFSACTAAQNATTVLQFSSPQYTVNEAGGSATITVTRAGGMAGSVSVAYATSDGTAKAGADYTAAAGVLTFAEGESSKTFTVPVLGDSEDEPDETVNLTLSNPTGDAVLGTRSTAVLTILNFDPIQGLQYYPLPQPVRLLDTRPNQAACSTPGAPLAAGSTRTQAAAGQCGLTIPLNARVIVGNATVVNTLPNAGAGFVTLFPSGAQRPTASNLNYAPGDIVPNSFTVGLGADGAFNIFALTETHFVVDVMGYYAPPGEGGLYYHPLPGPVRLLDTRIGQTACDAPGAQIQGGSSRRQPARLTCGGAVIPDNALALVGNATVVNPPQGGAGFVTLYPSGAVRPLVSNLNYVPGQIIANSFTVALGADGAFNIFPLTTLDIVVDVTGYYSASAAPDANGMPGLLYRPLASPVRLLDTRPGEPACTTPGVPLSADSTRAQPATGVCGGQTIPVSARAVVGNATVVNTAPNASAGFITLFPSGTARPTASNLNYVPGQIVPNAFNVRLGPDGGILIYSLTTTHFVTDLTGYFAEQ